MKQNIFIIGLVNIFTFPMVATGTFAQTSQSNSEMETLAKYSPPMSLYRHRRS